MIVIDQTHHTSMVRRYSIAYLKHTNTRVAE
jgi:hypothetical protein